MSIPLWFAVGCGNGHLLFALLEEDYPAKTMLGVDYSDASIQLSRDIAAAKQEEGLEGAEDISWQTVDILDPKQTEALGHFDLVLDKGVSSFVLPVCTETSDLMRRGARPSMPSVWHRKPRASSRRSAVATHQQSPP